MLNVKQAARQNVTLFMIVSSVVFYSNLRTLDAYLLRFNTYQEITQRAPYSNVNVVYDHSYEGWRYITINFKKHNCTRKSVIFVGARDGLIEYVEWEGLDGVPDDWDRSAGSHTLRLRLAYQERPFDWIELRTRHECGRGDNRINIQRILSHLPYKEPSDQPPEQM